MASIVLIETNGTVKTLKTKELSTETLYKKCGFRINEDFLCRHTWRVKLSSAVEAASVAADKAAGKAAGTAASTYTISVWAKKTGKAGGENKYDFPPPIDKDLFFGTCAIVRTKDTEGSSFLDLTKETWLKIYEKLFGGFEDIGDEDEYSEDELENVDPSLLTKNGYLKDGFVVSDKELTSGAPSTEDEDEEEKEEKKPVKKIVKGTNAKKKETTTAKPKETAKPNKPNKPNSKPKETTVKPSKPTNKPTKTEPEVKETSDSEGTTSELEEEVYTFSDDD